MKFISLFNKAPSHKRFSYAPRFYDEKEEKRKEREDRIRDELAREKGEPVVAGTDYRSRIKGAFHDSRKRSKKQPGDFKTTMLRSGIILAMVLFLMAYLTWGSKAVYGLIVLIPLYLYIKFKK